jgi:hypothetical protein
MNRIAYPVRLTVLWFVLYLSHLRKLPEVSVGLVTVRKNCYLGTTCKIQYFALSSSNCHPACCYSGNLATMAGIPTTSSTLLYSGRSWTKWKISEVYSFPNLKPGCVVAKFRRFGETYCFYLQDRRDLPWFHGHGSKLVPDLYGVAFMNVKYWLSPSVSCTW